MNINLDPTIITEFRDKANENPMFRNLYKNIDGKNKWNIICSAMDWISVSSREIKHINLLEDDKKSLDLMQYIITIDILVEAIIQLFRVLYGTNYKYPLHSSNSIFKQKTISDDRYFKHLRAAFGAHPVNLNSIDGINNKNEKFYASWSSKSFADYRYDYIVYLYSNDPEKEDMYELGINIEDINSYAESRYLLLECLKNKIDSITQSTIKKYIKKDIPTSDDVIEQLSILFDENSRRYGIYYGYTYELSYIIRVLKVYKELNIDNKVIKTYVDFLMSQISKIKSSIQNVDNKFKLLKANPKGYEFEKIYSYVNGYHPIGEQYYYKLITTGFLPKNLFISEENELKELILDAYLYKESNGLKKVIEFKDLINNDSL